MLWGPECSRERKAVALHMADPGTVLSGPSSLPAMIPGCTAKSNPSATSCDPKNNLLTLKKLSHNNIAQDIITCLIYLEN